MNREIAGVARQEIASREADLSGNFRGACPAYIRYSSALQYKDAAVTINTRNRAAEKIRRKAISTADSNPVVCAGQ